MCVSIYVDVLYPDDSFPLLSVRHVLELFGARGLMGRPSIVILSVTLTLVLRSVTLVSPQCSQASVGKTAEKICRLINHALTVVLLVLWVIALLLEVLIENSHVTQSCREQTQRCRN